MQAAAAGEQSWIMTQKFQFMQLLCMNFLGEMYATLKTMAGVVA
jgi:hypothetical protein